MARLPSILPSLLSLFELFAADLMVDGWLMHLGRHQGKWTDEKRCLSLKLTFHLGIGIMPSEFLSLRLN